MAGKRVSIDVTVRCNLWIDSEEDYRYAVARLTESRRPMLDGGSYGSRGSFTISPAGCVRVRRAPAEKGARHGR